MLTKMSPAQPHIDGLRVLTKRRCAAIITKSINGIEHYLLLTNTTPGYQNIVSFPNTGIKQDEVITIEEMQDYILNHVIIKYTGYSDVSYQKCLMTPITWSFHKPDEDYNEHGVYDHSIYICTLNEEIMHSAVTLLNHIPSWHTYEQCAQLFDDGESHGSSVLIWKIYTKEY